jgi:hypothetical protein
MKKCPKIKDKPAPVRAPTWLSRADKRAFLAELDRRSAGNCPLTPDQIDALADYVSARSRLAALQKIWRRALRQDRGAFRTRNDDHHILKIGRQIDAATASARRLAKALAMSSGDHRKKEGTRVKGARIDDNSTLANGAGLSPLGREAAP